MIRAESVGSSLKIGLRTVNNSDKKSNVSKTTSRLANKSSSPGGIPLQF